MAIRYCVVLVTSRAFRETVNRRDQYNNSNPAVTRPRRIETVAITSITRAIAVKARIEYVCQVGILPTRKIAKMNDVIATNVKMTDAQNVRLRLIESPCGAWAAALEDKRLSMITVPFLPGGW